MANRICSNSRATRRASFSLPSVITRKCWLRTSAHSLSAAAHERPASTKIDKTPKMSFLTDNGRQLVLCKRFCGRWVFISAEVCYGYLERFYKRRRTPSKPLPVHPLILPCYC